MKIETYQQLKEQQALSKLRLLDLEERIKDDFAEIKNGLKPMNLLGSTFSSMLKSERHGVLGESIGITVDMLIKKLLFRKSSFITKGLVSYVAKNYANSMVTKNAENILGSVLAMLHKYKNRHHQNGHHFDESTANIDLET